MTLAKKTIALAIVAMFVSSGLIVIADNIVIADATDDVALVDSGGTTKGTFSGEYAIHDALAAAANPTDTVKLLRSFTGVGIMIIPYGPVEGENVYMINQEGDPALIVNGLTIDFNGFTYKVRTPVGSSGAETHGFHIEWDYKLTLKNGTIAPVDDNARLQHPVEMLFWNHGADTVFDGMTLDGSKLVQGSIMGTKDANVYTLSNGSEGRTQCTIKDSTIVECKAKLENNKRAYAFDVVSKTQDIILKGDVVLDGGIDYSPQIMPWVIDKDFPAVVIDGNVTIKSGVLSSSLLFYPLAIMINSGGLTLAEGVIFGWVSLFDQDDNVTVLLSDIVAGAAGIHISKVLEADSESTVIGGEFKSVGEQSISIVSIFKAAQNIRLSGAICSNVTFSNASESATVVGVLEFQSGSKLEISGTTEPLKGTPEGSYVIFEKGSYKGETEMTEDRTYKMDDKGTQPKQVIVIFLVTSEHVKSITYDGKAIIEADYTSAGVAIDLSDISVSVDKGFELVGFNVDGDNHDVDDTVTVKNTCVITAIVQEEVEPIDPPTIPDDNDMLIIGSVLVIIIGLMFLVMVFRGKE